MTRPMRRSLAGLVIVVASLSPLAATAAGGEAMTVTASTARAGATHVRVALELRYEMQCNYPGPAPVVVTLPGRVPPNVAASAVLVNGKPAPGVSVRGRQLTVKIPPRPQILCDLIGPGRLTIGMTPRAGIANPAEAGSYRVIARKGTQTFSAPLRITGS